MESALSAGVRRFDLGAEAAYIHRASVRLRLALIGGAAVVAAVGIGSDLDTGRNSIVVLPLWAFASGFAVLASRLRRPSPPSSSSSTLRGCGRARRTAASGSRAGRIPISG